MLIWKKWKLMKNVKTIKERHKLVKKSRIPSKLGGSSATDKFMEQVRPDLKEKAENEEDKFSEFYYRTSLFQN